ncbi:hypothetical protein BU16DRAFT_537573 [Lophium mytilinum]|uniref:Uncharacterized protein n=1 Tax=Lophium mytilinum TaxID=390894 RepID=A0A6A6R185_9PEZI|nr:hypothetical protein BU16DRAFT_537573 [Lophium mytilinum]
MAQQPLIPHTLQLCSNGGCLLPALPRNHTLVAPSPRPVKAWAGLAKLGSRGPPIKCRDAKLIVACAGFALLVWGASGTGTLRCARALVLPPLYCTAKATINYFTNKHITSTKPSQCLAQSPPSSSPSRSRPPAARAVTAAAATRAAGASSCKRLGQPTNTTHHIDPSHFPSTTTSTSEMEAVWRE